jgi:hypothetical protein
MQGGRRRLLSVGVGVVVGGGDRRGRATASSGVGSWFPRVGIGSSLVWLGVRQRSELGHKRLTRESENLI